MAIIPLPDGAASNSNGGIEMQTPTRRSWNPLTWFSPAPTQPPEVEDTADDNATTIENHPSQPTARIEVKDRIDAAFAVLREAEAETALRDPKRKFDFQPDITPDDENWQSWFETFQTELQQGTVLGVLEKYFEDVHLLLIQPAPTDGVIFQLQQNNAAEYRRALAGRFSFQSNNLITKLTMLHFGLPVEPMTLNNILRAGHDENDPEDAPEEVPRVQRIMYAEKPLEFLDKYRGRSHGHVMLRRAETTNVTASGNIQPLPVLPEAAHMQKHADNSSGHLREPLAQNHQYQQARPIYPRTTAVSMRGGGGPVANEPKAKTAKSPSRSKSQVYSLDGSGAIFENTPVNFVRAVRTLPGLAGSTPLAVSFYSRQHDSTLPVGVRALTETILYTEGPPNSMYMNDIAKHMFNTVEEWTLVAHPRASKPPPQWPPNAKVPVHQTPIEKEKLPDIPRQILPPIPQHQLPQFNKPRIIQPQISKKPALKFDPWIAEEHRLDRLQRDSWWKDQSVVEPGRKPEAPYFGHPREMMLTLGSNLPTIYAQRLTPTDIGQLLDENQKLRNKVLERMENCNLCDVTFPMYEIEKIREHYKEHIEQIRSAGLCPMCGDDAWVFMSQDEKKSHLEQHQNYNELEKMKNFWKDLQCPVCDIDLSRRKSEDILQHMADHQPGIIRFCDRCSLDLKDCCRAELGNHQKNCLDYALNDSPQFGDLQVPIFCDKCGKERTFETWEESISHANYCCGFARSFCRTCGVDFNFLTHDECRRHSIHCCPPRGHRKTFCKRCSTNLTTLNPMLKESHDQDCYFQEHGQQSGRDRTSALEEIIAELRKRQAKNQSFIAHPRQRENEFEVREQSQQLQRNNTPGETIAEEVLRRLPELQAATDRLTEKVGLYKRATGGFDTLVGDTDTRSNGNQRSPKKPVPSTKKVRIETPQISDTSDIEDATSLQLQLSDQDIRRPASPKKSTLSPAKNTGKRKFATVEEVPDENLQPKKPKGTPKSKKQNSNQDSEFKEPEYFNFDTAATSAAAATPRRNTRSANGTPAPTTRPKSNKNANVDVDDEYNEDLLLEMEIANTIAGLIQATNGAQAPRTAPESKKQKSNTDTDKAYTQLEYFAEMAAAMGTEAPRRTTRSASGTPKTKKQKTNVDKPYKDAPLVDVDTETDTQTARAPPRRTTRSASETLEVKTKKQKSKVDEAYKDNPLIEETEAETATAAPRRTTRLTSETPATKTKNQKLNTDKAYKDVPLIELLDTGDEIIEPRQTKRAASGTPAPETVPKSKKRKLDVETESSLILMDTGAEISQPRRSTRAANGTPAPKTLPKSKKQKAGLEKDERLTKMAAEPRRSTRVASGTPGPSTRAVSAPAAVEKKAGRPSKKVVDAVLEEEEEEATYASPVKRKSPRKKA